MVKISLAVLGVSRPNSSAVTQKPRDVSRLSVVRFSSTIRRAQSSIIGYFGFRFTVQLNSVLFPSA